LISPEDFAEARRISRSRPPPLSSRHCLGTLQATWQRTAASSPSYAHPRRLCLAKSRTFLVSRTCTNFGDRNFNAAGTRVWNYVLTDLI